MQRGFSITLVNKQPVRSIHDVAAGNTMETFVADGKIESIVK
jgi:exonuclease VII large subunit